MVLTCPRGSTQRCKEVRRGGTIYRFDWITNFFQSKIDDSKDKKKKRRKVSNEVGFVTLPCVPYGEEESLPNQLEELEGADLQHLPSLLIPNIQTIIFCFHNDSRSIILGG